MWKVFRVFGSELTEALDRLPKTDTTSIAGSATSWLLGIAGILAIVGIIYSGTQISMSAGDAGKVAKAKNMLLFSIIGLVLIVLAYGIVSYIAANFG